MPIDRGKLERWVKSWAGCDGGNLDAPIWFCGIEWGAGDESYYKNDLPKQMEHGSVPLAGKYDWKGTISGTTGGESSFGRGVAKLYSAIRTPEIKDQSKAIEGYTGGEILKLNLYPIKFRNTDPALWQRCGMPELTGFSDKGLFREWCKHFRFAFFNTLVAEHKPKVVVGVGASYLGDYIAAFGGGLLPNSKLEAIHLRESDDAGRERTMYTIEIGHSLLAVVPFFSSQRGLNSQALIEKAGGEIRQRLPT